MEGRQETIKAAFEAILFSSAEAVSSKRVAQILNITPVELEQIAMEVIKKFDNLDSGIKVIKLENKYQMCSKAEYKEQIRNFMQVKRDTSLSSAAMEVLSVIAYKQPVTRAFIESVRGTDCREIVNSLIKKSLIEEKGRLGVPGNPIVYGTTDNFLRCMNISSIKDLPVVPEALVKKA